jgi:hypothetical protein
MRKRLQTVIAASVGAAVLAIVGATVTTANFTPRDGIDNAIPDSNADAAIDVEGVPAPVLGGDLFVLVAGDTASCMTAKAVITKLQADEAAYGGKLVSLTRGLEQAFADTWRREAHVPAVAVSGIVAHLFSDRDGLDWTADVVEFDKAGCAMSRTLVPGDIWNALVTRAAGVEI